MPYHHGVSAQVGEQAARCTSRAASRANHVSGARFARTSADQQEFHLFSVLEYNFPMHTHVAFVPVGVLAAQAMPQFCKFPPRRQLAGLERRRSLGSGTLNRQQQSQNNFEFLNGAICHGYARRVGWHGDPGDAHSILPLNVLQWSTGDTLLVTQRTVLSDGVSTICTPPFCLVFFLMAMTIFRLGCILFLT